MAKRCDKEKSGEPGAAELAAQNEQLRRQLVDLRQQLAALKDQLGQLRQCALTDTLTGLPNRRAFDLQLLQRVGEWHRYQRQFSLLLLDVDGLKSVNDRLGHAWGDRALRSVAAALTTQLRRTDLPARIGGDEFAVILPASSVEQLGAAAERVLGAPQWVQRAPAKSLTVKVSLGMAQPLDGESAEALVQRADQALYAAKQSGGHCAWLHDGGQARALAHPKKRKTADP